MSSQPTSPKFETEPIMEATQGQRAKEKETPKTKKPIGLIHLPTELLSQILSHYIAFQPLLEQHFPNPHSDGYNDIHQYATGPSQVSRIDRIMELMVPSSTHTKLRPAGGRLGILDHVALDVNTVFRDAYIDEVKKHFRPVLYLNQEDITKTTLDNFGASFDYLWNAPSFRLELFVMARGAPILSLTQNELDLLKPFVQKFSRATKALVNWSDVPDFHHMWSGIYVGKVDHSDFSTEEVEKILQSMPSLKKMKVWYAPRSYKLRSGRWTTDANQFNMEIIKEQMKQNSRRKALLQQQLA